jgi:hypothetical protein
MRTKQVMVRLTPEMYDQLKQLADSEERSVAQVVRLAVRDLLANLKVSTDAH